MANVIVSFRDFDLPPRYDGQQWIKIQIQEGASATGPWNVIETQNIDPTIDPANPEPLNFTTEKATLPAGQGWYLITFLDTSGDTSATEPVFNSGPIEILCTLDDVNAHFDGEVIEADANNTQLVQVSVSRVVKGYLARLVGPVSLASWASPDTTPDIIREIASMLIASQVYFNFAARTSLLLEDHNFAQRLYDEAMKMLQGIIDGTIPIVPVDPGNPPIMDNPDEMSDLDYFPVDNTDRAFTMSQQF